MKLKTNCILTSVGQWVNTWKSVLENQCPEWDVRQFIKSIQVRGVSSDVAIATHEEQFGWCGAGGLADAAVALSFPYCLEPGVSCWAYRSGTGVVWLQRSFPSWSHESWAWPEYHFTFFIQITWPRAQEQNSRRYGMHSLTPEIKKQTDRHDLMINMWILNTIVVWGSALWSRVLEALLGPIACSLFANFLAQS